MDQFLHLDEKDNVLVALSTVAAGTKMALGDDTIELAENIARAHKIAAQDIAEGDIIIKYGMPIGRATQAIAAGRHVHVHNIRSDYTPTYSLSDSDGVRRPE